MSLIYKYKNLHSSIKLVISIILCEAIGFTSGMLSVSGIKDWYPTIVKPSWNPPSYVFGPVWTFLYLLMGISLWLVWSSEALKTQKTKAIQVFGLQLFANFIWSILFFKMQSPFFALIDIVLMVALVVLTIFKFYPISRLSSWLLIPYLLWISFATVLNYTIWVLN